jgi:hypothetical protein
MLMTRPSYYDLLSVPRTATSAQIKQAYRRLAREFHPDVNRSADATARFKQLNEAYTTLTHSERRAAYDQMLVAASQPRASQTIQRSGPTASGPTPGGSGEFFAWNAAYYSTTNGERTAKGPVADTAVYPPPVTSLGDALFRFGQRPIPWVLTLTAGLSIGALVWWEGSAAGRNGVLILMLLCAASILFLFRAELHRWRHTLTGRAIRLLSMTLRWLGISIVFTTLLIALSTLISEVEGMMRIVQALAAIIIGIVALRWFVMTGRKWRDRIETESPEG